MDWNAERARIEAEWIGPRTGRTGGPISATVNGERSAKTIGRRNAWDYFPFEHAARARIAGARTASLGSATTACACVSRSAFWNGADPILKERFFGLNNREGNHGEDVKELYYYLDNMPSHAYMSELYKYPQRAFPLRRLARRPTRGGTRSSRNTNSIDTGIFNDNRLLRRPGRICQGDDRRHPDPDQCDNRGRPARRCTCSAALVRNDWSWRPGVPPKPASRPLDGAQAVS